MDIGARPRRGRFFGKSYYDVPEADALFCALEQELMRLSSMQEEIAQKHDALSETLQGEWEINRSLQSENASLQERVAQLASERAKLADEFAQLNEKYISLADEHAKLEDAHAALEDGHAMLRAKSEREQSVLRVEGETLSQQIDALKDELTRAATRTTQLTANLERRQAEIDEYESLIASDAVSKASERAQRIVSNAIAESDRIFNEINAQRTRVIAATRAAYYNALQFKMSLAERFSAMERDLDDAIDVLRILETPAPADVAPQAVYHIDDTSEPYCANDDSPSDDAGV